MIDPPGDTLVHTMDRDEDDLSIAHRPCAWPDKSPAWNVRIGVVVDAGVAS